MIDQILTFCREHSDGTTAAELAERFLKFKNAGNALAAVAVKALLGKDKRFYCNETGRWFGVRAAEVAADKTLVAQPWSVVHVLTRGKTLCHLSIWALDGTPKELLSEWLENPGNAGFSGVDSTGPVFDPTRREPALVKAAGIITASRPFFLAGSHHALLGNQLALVGEELTDDITLAARLFRAAGLPTPRPFDLVSCYAALFSREPQTDDAARCGALLAECLVELLDRLKIQNIESVADLEAIEEREVASFDFSHKKFSAADIAALPALPGVYGFKRGDGAYFYIGKSSNLKRRISSYFGETDESPEKLSQLRSEAVELMTSVCGSELESLIYEYRLINKYKPRLNTQRTIEERKGSFKPVPDSIILLPHADEHKGVSVWFRSGQKITIRPFAADLSDTDGFADEMQTFFFGPPLPASATDFPEQEIASRWIKRHRDSLVVVPVDRMASGKEVCEAMKRDWIEMAAGS